MTQIPWMPPPTKDFAAAKRQYVELYGSLAVMNTYLKIAVLAFQQTLLPIGSSWIPPVNPRSPRKRP